jgi:arylsulfatase A-like enzyme
VFGVLLLLGKLHQVAALIFSLGVAVAIGRWLSRREYALRTCSPWHPTGLARRQFLAALALGIVGAQWDVWRERYLVSRLPPANKVAPNLLIMTLDTLRADHLSCYGYRRPTTPHLDRLAEGGVLFQHAIANSSWTLPAHASLFTGRLPHEHKADWWAPLDEKYPTLAEVLAAQGYLTAAFAANTSYVAPEWGLGRGFAHFEVYGSSLADDVVRTVYGRKLALNLLPRLGYFDIPGRKRASQVNREFLRWLDDVSGRPFFAFLNYLDVHDPYLTPAPHLRRFAEEVMRGDRINFQFQAYAFRRKPTLTAEEIQVEVNAYDECLAYLDTQLGALFSELARRGLAENTLMIITSDHGESFGNHDLFGHGNSLYLETLHVPLIFYWPGRIPSGMRIPQIVGLQQIPATLLEALGGAAVTSLPGRSLAGLWGGERGDQSDMAILSEVSSVRGGPPSYPTTGGALKSLVTEEWHFILAESGRAELYRWREDLQESHNLAETARGQLMVQAFSRQLQHLLYQRDEL